VPERILLIENLNPTVVADMYANVPAGFEVVVGGAWDEAEHVRLVAGAEYIVCGGVPVTGAVVEAGRKLRLIQKLGVGVDKIDLAAAARCRVPVAITAGTNAPAVAEATFMLMLAVFRQLLKCDVSMRQGTWIRPDLFGDVYELAEKTLGIVGLGHIGKQVARRAAAFDMRVLYHDVVRPSAEVEARLGARFVPLDELLAASDVVSLHVPFTRETRHLIDARALGLMKPTAVLINTARGEVVDEAALEAALRGGRLRGAGLDVLQREPIRAPRPLFDLPNVVLCPHMAGLTRDTWLRMWRHACANCVRVARGEPLRPEDRIDAEVFRVAAG